MKFVRVLSRRSLLAMFTSVALIFSGGSVFADNVKVAAIYTLPVEQQWISRIHKALNSAQESGGVEYVYSENVSNTDDFLVKKRAPLVLPPQFDKIPSPNEAKDKVKEENEEIKKLLKSKNEDESGKTKHSSVEDRIINIINK